MSTTQDLFVSACTRESGVERELRRDLAGTSRELDRLRAQIKSLEYRVTFYECGARQARDCVALGRLSKAVDYLDQITMGTVG